jgi:hypothetical protein
MKERICDIIKRLDVKGILEIRYGSGSFLEDTPYNALSIDLSGFVTPGIGSKVQRLIDEEFDMVFANRMMSVLDTLSFFRGLPGKDLNRMSDEEYNYHAEYLARDTNILMLRLSKKMIRGNGYFVALGDEIFVKAQDVLNIGYKIINLDRDEMVLQKR